METRWVHALSIKISDRNVGWLIGKLIGAGIRIIEIPK